MNSWKLIKRTNSLIETGIGYELTVPRKANMNGFKHMKKKLKFIQKKRKPGQLHQSSVSYQGSEKSRRFRTYSVSISKGNSTVTNVLRECCHMYEQKLLKVPKRASWRKPLKLQMHSDIPLLGGMAEWLKW